MDRGKAMDFRGNQVVVVVEDGGRTSSLPVTPMTLCRICHEEEEESSSSMENPCACSGTLKFAHRSCIQRWCDEKGSTVCEVCLQSFEPNYTVTPKKALIEVGVTIRQSVEVGRLEGYRLTSSPISATLLEVEEDAAECSPLTRRRATYCHSIALTLTLVLLTRYLISVVTIGADSYAFTILTVLLLRVMGILLPLYVVARIAYIIKKLQREEWVLPLPEDMEDTDDFLVREDSQLREHTIQIHS